MSDRLFEAFLREVAFEEISAEDSSQNEGMLELRQAFCQFGLVLFDEEMSRSALESAMEDFQSLAKVQIAGILE